MAPVGVRVGVPCQPAQNCQQLATDDAYNSTGGPQYLLADDFKPALGGAITDLCWYGVYTPSPSPDAFAVRYYEDENGLPGALLAEYSQSAGTLVGFTRADTGLVVDGTTYSIYEYTAQHAPFSVVEEKCYWIEISNDIDPDSWYWAFSGAGEGNLRSIQDGTPPDGYEANEFLPRDLSFCVGLELSQPACGIEALFNTGPEQLVQWDASGQGNFQELFLGWSSGDLTPDLGMPQRWMAQPFTLPPVPWKATAWRITLITADGFVPDGAANETLHFVVWKRSGIGVGSAPVDGDQIVRGSIPFPGDTFNNPEGGKTGSLHAIFTDFSLAPGDYWLTVYAGNSQPGVVPSNFAWFTAAPEGINNLDGSGNAFAWRSEAFPEPGFEFYQLDDQTIQPGKDTDPADLYNTAFSLHGTPSWVDFTFEPPRDFPVTNGRPARHAIGDLDGNGYPDVAVVVPDLSPGAPGSLAVFRNDGVDAGGEWRGLIGPGKTVVGLDPTCVALGLIDDDDSLDAAVTNGGEDTVSILINQGNGTFAVQSTVNVCARPSSVVLKDFSGDDFADLIVTNQDDDLVVVLLNDGSGGFNDAQCPPRERDQNITVGDEPVSSLADDFDNNDPDDVAGTSRGSTAAGGLFGSVFVLHANPDGTFDTPPLIYDIDPIPRDLTARNVEPPPDNDVDLVVAHESGKITVLFNQGDGTFLQTPSVQVGEMTFSIDAADLDNDTDADVALAAYDSVLGGVVMLLENLGVPDPGPVFGSPVFLDIADDPVWILNADMNDDNAPDVVTANQSDSGGSVTVLLNTSEGFPPRCPADCGDNDKIVGIIDFLALLSQWGQIGGSCDMGLGDPGVGIQEFLELLGAWGPCPS
jgi:hypothetical protein